MKKKAFWELDFPVSMFLLLPTRLARGTKLSRYCPDRSA
jgi:hypothetical protein